MHSNLLCNNNVTTAFSVLHNNYTINRIKYLPFKELCVNLVLSNLCSQSILEPYFRNEYLCTQFSHNCGIKYLRSRKAMEEVQINEMYACIHSKSICEE